MALNLDDFDEYPPKEILEASFEEVVGLIADNYINENVREPFQFTLQNSKTGETVLITVSAELFKPN